VDSSVAPVLLACMARGLLRIYSISRSAGLLHNAKAIDDAITAAGVRLMREQHSAATL
jgi:hypothetical protein